MPRRLLGLIAGVIYGAVSAASMIPLTFDDQRAALPTSPLVSSRSAD